MNSTGLLERACVVDVARTVLPGKLGTIGTDPGFVAETPVLGLGDASRLVFWHQDGLTGCCLMSVFIIPDEDLVIVVLVTLWTRFRSMMSRTGSDDCFSHYLYKRGKLRKSTLSS